MELKKFENLLTFTFRHMNITQNGKNLQKRPFILVRINLKFNTFCKFKF